MPIKNSPPTSSAAKHYKSTSFENLLASWLLSDGWDTYTPMIDHGRKTDVLVLNGNTPYRIQVKSLESSDESAFVSNQWGSIEIDYVIYFSRSSNWGYIAKPFKESCKQLNSSDHIRFHQHPTNFIKAFNRA